MKVNAISRWIQMTENDLVQDSVSYSFLTITDIKNFYPSIYTHSIAWSVNSKEKVKSARRDMNLLENRLDKLFQNAKDGQTNGIPVGSMVSDIIAEIILKDVDGKISSWLRKQSYSDEILISRYRDDYRILSKTREQGTTILKELSKVLEKEYNLILNSDKTKVFEDILEGSFRNWSNEINDDYLLRSVKYLELSQQITASLLKDILFKTYRLQKRFPEGRASITLLSKLTEHLMSNDVFVEVDKTDIHTIISILRKLALVREEVSAQTYLLLDILLKKLDGHSQTKIINELHEVIKDQSDQDYQIIWLYRLCLSNCIEKCDEITSSSDSPLINLFKKEYIGESPSKYDYEVFDSIQNLSAGDAKELTKFRYLDKEMLDSAKSVAIDRELYDLFKY